VGEVGRSQRLSEEKRQIGIEDGILRKELGTTES
jgi:hypothetical protein